MTVAEASKAKKDKQRYGIAEWFGRLYRTLDHAERIELAAAKSSQKICPFMAQVPALGPKSKKLCCNKPGGVCSIRNFVEVEDGGVSFGAITATCPNRFLEHGTIVKHISSLVLGAEDPLFAKELPFLRRPTSVPAQASVAESEAEGQGDLEHEAIVDPGKEDVGRIDRVFVDPADHSKWCAVEIQAVYFSGSSMGKDFTAIKEHSGNGFPMPGGTRRPDYRSSGPKRLMPQLMVKVPTLRRWGKKMVVVVDKPFFEALDFMAPADHVSNCDIVWVVVRFDEDLGSATLTVDSTVFTTLEEAVKGLTAGQPTTLPEFQAKLDGRTAPALPATTGLL